ncbi:aryl-sulfate sulfotransferase (plasmid) [Halorussus salilacus]|uniref:arylsulfotransferase family protein n=1 Tax=Halorussus salilacus TaxID=2953750 RepID=UPI00209E4FD8|nr:aryl-sulfate sulfotransferase [Halorussus salilacus]USZ69800.1 aryl-sulfate sulfotransferase [Halorussus salilacus]
MATEKTRFSRAWLVRGMVLVLIVSLLAPSAVSALTYEPTNLQKGTIDKPANGTTVISIQGFKFAGQSSGKKPARIVGVSPRGDVEWVHNGSNNGVTWFYDVDPLDNGNLLISGTAQGASTVYEWDPQEDEIVWSERFEGVHDTHDADLINDGEEILVANMRNYNTTSEENEDRIFVYDREDEEITWEWHFDDHTNWTEDQGGPYAAEEAPNSDWTHVNDVDKIDDGQFLVSPRNMDQVMVINRSTKEIDMRLGEDDNYDIMHEQHNPDYHESENGTPTITVADSENDRVVEYAKRGDDWQRTWELGSNQDFNWPRDADRLPNGNTLVVDSNNQRVIEVNPEGEVVWEFYAPWAPYDVERMHLGDEPGGPTIADQDAEGSYDVSGSAGITPGTGERLTFSQWLSGAFAGTAVEAPADAFANRWSKIAPWVRPVWMGPWDFVGVVVAALVLVSWILGELVYNRKRIRNGVGRRLA